MHSTITKIIAEISAAFPERDEIIRSAVVAALAQTNMLLLGPPGTAKSALFNALSKKITGSQHFVRLLTKFSTPEEVFGPISIKALETGSYERVIDGMLPKADTAFIDEIFKANSSILNSLLTIMNEGEFDNGTVRLKAPLMCLYGASNELPQTEDLGALFDRFTLRHNTHYISDESNMANLLMNPVKAGTTTIDLNDLRKAQADVKAVTIDRPVVDLILNLKRQCAKDGFSCSDRRWIQSMDILKACAYLEGRTKVEQEDLLIYAHVLWDKPEQIKDLGKIIGKVVSPELTKINDLYDAAMDLINKFQASDKNESLAIETCAKLKQINASLGKLKGQGGAKGKTIVAKVEAGYKNILKQVMGDAGD